MNSNIIYLVPILGILSLLYTAWKSAWVTRQDAGDAKMTTIAGYISEGAMAFLKAEYRVLTYFAIIASILLGVLSWNNESPRSTAPLVRAAHP